ncbi:ferrous iron transport protein B [Desulfovibrio sp. OttesenSCG-928-O18]|nr:ferrous iron transport protein B [Desulfovibrio sp. OttesenSCG-928-O18]
MKPITVALAGNPNAGKTTMFNAITGARQHVGNYPGITVEKKTGSTTLDGETIAIVDLPGTYSLTAYSQEEVVARRMLTEERPDVVLHVVDAGALERNLYLTVQLLELGIPVVLALNMMDEVRKRGDSIDTKRLARLLGVPVVETVGRTGIGVTEALRTAVAVGREAQGKAWEPRVISYGPDIDPVLAAMTGEVETCLAADGKREAVVYPPRWVALKFLENDPDIREAGLVPDETLGHFDREYDTLARHLAGTLQTYPEATIADFRYGYISGLLRQDVVTRHKDVAARRNFSDRVDRLLTHNLLGIAALVLIFYLVYQIAFSLGSIPMDMVDGFFSWLGDVVGEALPDGLLKSLIVSGIIGGVGGVMTFVPLIFIMFLMIAFLEDSGYMARIAYILDRVFRMFGLHGSSIMPYIISGGIAGGCAVPGVMATRTLRSPKEKLATMLTLPFMACGAKIPVFLLIVGAFFAEENQAAIMLGITITGWVLALFSARILRSTIITGAPTPFVMELPPYRLPTLRGLLLHTWERGWQYLKKAGTIILAISIVMWALLTFPGLPEDVAQGYDTKIEAAEGRAEEAEKAYAANKGEPEKAAMEEAKEAAESVKNEKSGAALRHSVAGRIGTALEPLSELAGFEWRTNVALLGGFAAKEVLVTTLGTAYSLGEVDPEEAQPLSELIKSDPHWNKANAASLLIFVLIYAPCVVTIAAIRQETASWRWPLFSLIGSTVLAYALAVGVYQVGRLIV